MKKNGALKLAILIVSIILIALISFVGIYKKDGSEIKNILPDYLLGKELNGTRIISFVAHEDETEEETTEENTDETAEETTEEVKEEEKTEKKENVLTNTNFELTKRIMQKRLNKFGVDNYDIRVNKENGTIALELTESDGIDDILVYIYSQGKFQISDSETEEVLLDNSHITEAKTMYYNGTDGINVYLDIVFDVEGKAKLEEISKTYVETTDEEGNTTQKTVTIKLDDETVTTTYFGQTMSTGELPLTIGSASKDNSTLNKNLRQSEQIAILLNNGVTPIEYEINTNEYVAPIIEKTMINTIAIVAIAVLVVLHLYLIYRFKTNGIISTIAMLGYLALYLLVVRYTDTIISLEAMGAIGIGAILEFILLHQVSRKIDNDDDKVNVDSIVKKELIQNIIIQIPLYIMSIVFVFANWETIKSFGTALFWGLIISVLYNFTITRMLFIEKDSLKK